MALHGEQLLGGEISAEGDQTFHGVNPVTGESLDPPFTEATQAEIDRAFTMAQTAHRELRSVAIEKRASFLRAIATEIEALGDSLLERASAETGLPIPRLTNERGRTCMQLRMFAALVEESSWVEASIDHGDPDRAPIPKPDLRRMLVPLGPVVVFGASNFPLAYSVAGGDTASALAAGCPVLVKAHPNHPGTSEMVGAAVAAAAESCEMPRGIFSLIQGASHATGARLVEHPAAKAVGFTGSLGGGRALFDLAAARPEPIPVYAEMGSTNPVFLLPEAMAGAAAEDLAKGLCQSVLLGVGQFCTNPGLIITCKNVQSDTLLAGMRAQFAAASPGTMLHAGIRQNYQAGLLRVDAVEGVVTHPGSVAGDAGKGTSQASPHLACTDATTFLANPVLTEEVFGPATLVVLCADRAEMVRVAENVGGQLTATVHGTAADLAANQELIATLTEVVGRLVFNGFPTGVEVCASMQHGGPYPASSAARSTSVGKDAIRRFARPVCYQNMPDNLRPAALRADNPLGILRLVDGAWSREGEKTR